MANAVLLVLMQEQRAVAVLNYFLAQDAESSCGWLLEKHRVQSKCRKWMHLRKEMVCHQVFLTYYPDSTLVTLCKASAS